MTVSAPSAPGRRNALLAVAALTVLAAVLRALLVDQSAEADELFLYEIVHDHGLGHVIRAVHDTESTPPLYFLVAWAAAKIGGDDFLWIRLPSLVLSAATVPLIYALGARTVGRTAGVIAAAVFAIAPFDLFYGTEGRAYATVAFLSAASTLSLLEVVRTGRRRWVISLVVTTVAALYTHYTVVFVVGAQLAWALWTHRERARLVLAAYVAVALAFAPWIPSYVVQSHDSAVNRITALYPLNAHRFARGLTQVWFGHPFTPLRVVPGRLAEAFIVLGLAGSAALATLTAARRRVRPRIDSEVVLVLLLAAVTPVAALLYSLGPTTFFLPRNMSASVPAATVATGALLAAARRPLIVAALTAAVLGGLAIGTVRTFGSDLRRPDFRGIAHELDRVASPHDPILELTVFTGLPGRQLGYWFRRPHQYVLTGQPLTRAFATARRGGRFYVVTVDGPNRLLELINFPARGFRLVSKHAYPGLARFAIYAYEFVRRGG